MKKRYKALIIIALAIILISFTTITPSTFILGDFAGECIGRCENTFTITDNTMQIDEISHTDSIPSIHKTINGNFKRLKIRIPLIILFHLGRFGCPDCADGGGYILGFKLFGITFKYELDPQQKVNPWYFPHMTETVGDRLKELYKLTGEE